MTINGKPASKMCLEFAFRCNINRSLTADLKKELLGV